MSKKDFLKKLSRELNGLPAAERKKTMDYYSELIDDRKEEGFTEESAVDAMGDVKGIANEILNDARERGVVIKKRHSALFWGLLSALLILLGIAVIGLGVYFILTRVFNTKIAEPLNWNMFSTEYDLSDSDGVNIDIKDLDLYIGVSEDKLVHVTYYECDQVKFVISRENGLTIKQEGRIPIVNLLSEDSHRQVQVLVPESFGGNIDSNLTTGETKIEQISPSVLNADTTTGTMSIKKVTAETIHAGTTTGLLRVEDSKAAAGRFGTTTGELSITDCSFSGELRVTGSTGLIYIGPTECGALDARASTGKIVLHNVKADTVEAGLTTGKIEADSLKAGRIVFESTTGDISFGMLECPIISMSATTGDITGVLVGYADDYTIESSTSTGSNTLPEHMGSGAKKADFRTTTGDIEVHFGLTH